MKTQITIITTCLAFLTGAISMGLYANKYIKHNINQITCIETVTINNKTHCAIFTYDNATYATQHAPTYEIG